MMKKNIRSEEEAVKVMAKMLLDRFLLNWEDEMEAASMEQWMNTHAEARRCFTELSEPQRLLTKLRHYKRCSIGTRKAFQELMHRVAPAGSPQPDRQALSDSLI
jgi:hypothetical protein